MRGYKQLEESLIKLFPRDKELFNKKLKEGIPMALPGYHFPLAFGTLKWLSEEVCQKMITARVMVYLSMANKFIERYGDEARELIKQIQYEDGFMFGERCAKFAEKKPGTIRNQEQ